MTIPNNTAVAFRGVTKTFGEVYANRDVSMDIYKGEILSLLGENGSGKTTLMNMLSGIYCPDAGEIYLDGKLAAIRSPQDAHHLGIGMIHQHFKLVDVFTAAENVLLGVKGKGLLDLSAASEAIRRICETYGFELDPSMKVYDMSVPEANAGDRKGFVPRRQRVGAGRAHRRFDPSGDGKAVYRAS